MARINDKNNNEELPQGVVKLTQRDGSIIEGTPEVIAKLGRLIGAYEVEEESDKEVGSDDKNEVIYDKPARVGDTIRIVDVHPISDGEYNIGDIFVVSNIDVEGDKTNGVIVEGNMELILPREFEIIGREEADEEEKVENAFDVGDIVRVVSSPSAHAEGSLVVVMKESPSGNYACANEVDELFYDEDDLQLVAKKSDRYDIPQKLYPGDKVILDAGDAENKLPLLGLYNGHEYEVIYEGGEHDTPEGQYWISDGHDAGFATIVQLRKVGD